MKKLFLICLLFLGACSSIDQVLFGVTPTNNYSPEVSNEESSAPIISESSLKKDYYGFPIFELILDDSQSDYKDALFYAIQQSQSRTQTEKYRLVGWIKNSRSSIKSKMKTIKKDLIEMGISEKKILIKYESAPTSQKQNRIRLYER
ncbi:MAG: hypothetical protein ACTSXV_00790 [Alphaproteobacteria bacterium]